MEQRKIRMFGAPWCPDCKRAKQFLVEPSNAELAEKLDIRSQATRQYYDLLIVGAGPAALTAGIYAAREGLSTLLIERSGIGGQAGTTRRSRTTLGSPAAQS